MDPAQVLEATVLAQQRPMLAAMAQGESEVQRFYKNCTVFLTGGSGFLGKQLIEKLFRCCLISKVYILLRPKKGKGLEERIQEMIKDPAFDTVRSQQPTFLEKIIAIEGDVAELRLGIKDQDWNMLINEVNVIIHAAATTRFDETLRMATLINVRGTRETLLLGKACKNLKSFVHVSTAYTHATMKTVGQRVYEQFYLTPVPPTTMISIAEKVEPNRLNKITANLIEDWPNTYTFTKAISEELIRTESAGLPICIVRPAVVMSTYREPCPGWLDVSCLYGITGITFGGGLGLIHAFYVNLEARPGFIPCDYVNNAIIAAAADTAKKAPGGGADTKIYTVSASHRNPITYGRSFADIMQNEAIKYVSPKSLYISLLFTSNKNIFAILSLFLHIIPGYFADFVCLLLGKKRRFAKITKKMYKMCTLMGHFALNEWDFVDNNLESLYDGLSTQDQAIFNFDVKDIDWLQYFLAICIGIRRIILKDGLRDTEYAVKKQKYLRVVYYVFMTLYVYLIWKCICFVFFGCISLLSTIIYTYKSLRC